MRTRQLRWLVVLANLPSVVGLVHRLVASRRSSWREPPGALASALAAFGWQMQRNMACSRASSWPVVFPEVSYPGTIRLQPEDDFPLEHAAFTDGSVMDSGGAAVVVPDTDVTVLARVPSPRSSTQCELVALGLALQQDSPHVLSDSLAALHMLRSWAEWSLARRLRCPDRHEVRWVLSLASARSSPPLLEKVKAHDDHLLRLQHPKAVGNDLADAAARRATSETAPPLTVDLAAFADPVSLLDAQGRVVEDVPGRVAAEWWERRQQSRSERRVWLDLLYPPGWLCTGSCRRRCSGGRWCRVANLFICSRQRW